MKNESLTKIIMATRSSMPPIEEYIEEIRPLWKSCWLSNDGLIHQKFEKQIKEYLNAENADLFVNGHMTLELILAGMDLEGEVITTPFTFISTSNAIVRNGLKPVFCDIKRDDFTIDPKKIEELITDKTCAIVPVHIYGYPCDVEEIDRIAKKHGLKVVYDAAQAFGTRIDGKDITSFGDASMISFHATKAFHTIEGGVAVYKDSSFKEVMRRVGNFGTLNEAGIDAVSPNAKMNEFQAAMGVCNLRHVDEEIAKREKIDSYYRERLKDVSGVHFAPKLDSVTTNHTYMPMLIEPEEYGYTRDEILKDLFDANIFGGKFFSPLIVEFDYYSKRYTDSNLPNARYVADNILAVPIYPAMEIEDIERTCSIIIEKHKNKK